MKRHHHDPPTWAQQPYRLGQTAFDLPQFVVDRQPQSLERTRGGMMAGFVRRQHGANNTGEPPGGLDRGHSAGGDDGASDAARRSLLPKSPEHVGEIAFGQSVHQIGGGAIGGRLFGMVRSLSAASISGRVAIGRHRSRIMRDGPISAAVRSVRPRGAMAPIADSGWPRPTPSHAHIEGSIMLKGKSPGRIVDLKRRHADIQHDTVQRVHAGADQQRQHVAETPMQQMQPAGIPRRA